MIVRTDYSFSLQGSLEDSGDFGTLECPFCGDVYSDLAGHIRECELAPEDVRIEDVLPDRKKKKKKPTKKTGTGAKSTAEKKKCPYCGKEFLRLGRHLNACSKKPAEVEDK